jgi:hypothetical protein
LSWYDERRLSMQHDAFDQLSNEDQKAAIDTAVAAILIGLRIPSTGKPLYDFVASEFASSRGLPANVVKYALRSLGRSLTAQNWTLSIVKDGEGVITKFVPEKGPMADSEKEVGV